MIGGPETDIEANKPSITKADLEAIVPRTTYAKWKAETQHQQLVSYAGSYLVWCVICTCKSMRWVSIR